MIIFFQGKGPVIYAVSTSNNIGNSEIEKLSWLFGQARLIEKENLEGYFIGPRREMVTPWSTNAVEITQNMGIRGIDRIEEFVVEEEDKVSYDVMLQQLYRGLDQQIFHIEHQPEPLIPVQDIGKYNKEHGLALSNEEVIYLEELSKRLNRPLTDCEVFGFSQVNSEHCRHKIFNGQFIIDGKAMDETLFQLIKKTSRLHPGLIVSAYSDNVAFIEGPKAEQFAPITQHQPDYFTVRDIETVISLKAETHNFPTTVEPFNGAATGSGGEIRDRMAGGKGSMPLAGTAVYITSYPRLDKSRSWEFTNPERKWLYQTPLDILIKASNGASDFGNKFGQPLICGSVLTFEHKEQDKTFGYDKVIMLAGGVGFALKKDAMKDLPKPGDRIIVMGGDNYRIGMGGGAVSSVATGEYANQIELNAVQRSNPEMQKRVYNVIRAMAESEENHVVSIHDHGAGGHLNSISELIEATGGTVNMNKLPIGDPTLSPKELAGNESQERMGLVMHEEDLDLIQKISERERAPFYNVGEAGSDHRLVFDDPKAGNKPIDLDVHDFFGKPPQTVLDDKTTAFGFGEIECKTELIETYIKQVLQLESVACKDWLTNKVDRSVTGKVATQQCTGSLQLPLNNVGVMALDYQGIKGVATAIGHGPVAALISPRAGSRLSIAEALTNIVWAPLTHGLEGVSLSANWMWPAKNPGEDARLYEAVKAASDFAIELGINIPTGKDSLSMTQKYPDGSTVFAPGTVIISAVAEVEDIRNTVTPAMVSDPLTTFIYIDFSHEPMHCGGSAFSQTRNKLGTRAPEVASADHFKKAFNALQELIKKEKILAGHDVSAGGLVTCLLEMAFAGNNMGLAADLSSLNEPDLVKLLLSENPAVVIQTDDLDFVSVFLHESDIPFHVIGKPLYEKTLQIKNQEAQLTLDIEKLRRSWFKTSWLMDQHQSGKDLAEKRYRNFDQQALSFIIPEKFNGSYSQYNIDPKRRKPSGIKAAIIREKGVNGDREMAWSLYLAGFDVKDVHMTDLISGHETLEDINMIAFVGGFSNSDVLGSAKGWAGAFLYNPRAKEALDKFYARPDTLSLGVCNGCQLMVELGLIYPDHKAKPKMLHNTSGKFESDFLNVGVPENPSVMLGSLAGSRLGIWIAHGEGRFSLPYEESKYRIAAKYSYTEYPGNPNGSDYATAAICSTDGRHLAIMPHLERSLLPWQWAHYPAERKKDEVSPWVEGFVNAINWVRKSSKTQAPNSKTQD
ncbi:MAG: phosphoribosylformylglycinamidine synthase [Bacteroidales bacterium]|nr:phosphoribosylformylglycinamidine synthase [Bacteroidales bacterium]